MISGYFYKKYIIQALHGLGPMSVAEIKEALLTKSVKLDETQILQALDVMLRYKEVKKSEISGKYVKNSVG